MFRKKGRLQQQRSRQSNNSNSAAAAALSKKNNNNRLLQDCRNSRFRQFNEIIGLPTKDEPGHRNVEHPIYDYEFDLANRILTYQHIWMLKSRGLGITEIILRFLAWLCLSSDYYAGKFFHIVTGQTEKKAARLIERLETILRRKYRDVSLESKYTELILNQTTIQAFPTKALKDMRGDVNVSYIFVDEADFFDKSEQEELPYVIKSYEEKSNAKVIMVSTPNRPDGLFHAIERGESFRGFFHMIKWNYEVGLDKIYSRAFIDREKLNPEFEREYNLKYLGKVGNVFSPQMIDDCIRLGEEVKHLAINQYAIHSMGVDPGFGSSMGTVYILEYIKEQRMLKVVAAKEYDRSVPSQMAKEIFEYHKQINNLRIFVDGSNAGFVNELKLNFNESQRWSIQKGDTRSQNPNTHKVVPINFATEHKQMLYKTFDLVSKRKVAIPAKYDKLLTAMRTATAADFDLNKDETVNDDHLDALRLALRPFKIE